MAFPHSHGIGTARAIRTYKTYGADAIQVMTENPYRLARDIRGIGFKTAAAIAIRLGNQKTAMIRICPGILHALTQAMDEGHSSLPTDETVALTSELLVIDETSMIDVLLMQVLLRAAPDNAAPLVVGDIDRLASVGPDQVLSDTTGSGTMPVVRLTDVLATATLTSSRPTIPR